MASAALRDELTCSICLNVYTAPVTLSCGHSYCYVCIGDVLDMQKRSGAYNCPECRMEFEERPKLEKNRKLCNIVESFLYVHPEKEVNVFCTYCDSPVPAAKTCLHCEASLCSKHLMRHSKSSEHILIEPTSSSGNQKWPSDKKNPDYSLFEDASCNSTTCSLVGEHSGHQVETLNETAEKKKEKLRKIMKKLISKREEAEERVRSLLEIEREAHEKASGVAEQVNALIKYTKEQLETLEKRVLSEISRQEDQVSLRVLGLIQQLETEKKELSRKIGHIEELCNMADPVDILQDQESDRVEFCGSGEQPEDDVDGGRDGEDSLVGNLDVDLIASTLYSGLDDIVSDVKRKTFTPLPEASDPLLDLSIIADIIVDRNTASNHVTLSDDLKTASWCELNQGCPETPERFQDYPQVLGDKSFSSGRHYWEVETGRLEGWRLGVAYPSIGRKGYKSLLGYNKKSWCLWRWCNQYSVRHDNKGIQLSHRPSCQRLGISLDYEAGHLIFYELCDPIRHLHTITATFTEPLHFALMLGKNTWVKIV